MKRLRGFRLGKTDFRWIKRPRRNPAWLNQPAQAPVTKLVSRLARFLSRGANRLRFPTSDPEHIQLGRVKEAVEVDVPKGHLAVYVGESDGHTRRVVLPLIYLNHPLFGELLKEAERVYGYEHEGGITIPCGYSEFEKVQMRIASWLR